MTETGAPVLVVHRESIVRTALRAAAVGRTVVEAARVDALGVLPEATPGTVALVGVTSAPPADIAALAAAVPVIAVATAAEMADVDLAVAHGAAEVIRLPVDATELRIRLDAVAGRAPARTQPTAALVDVDALAPGDPIGILAIEVRGLDGLLADLGPTAVEDAIAVAGDRLRSALRPGDLSVRWADHRFVVLAPLGATSEVVRLARRLHRRLTERPVCAGAVSFVAEALIGGAAGVVADLDAVLRTAEDALHEATVHQPGEPVVVLDRVGARHA